MHKTDLSLSHCYVVSFATHPPTQVTIEHEEGQQIHLSLTQNNAEQIDFASGE